MKIIDKFLHFFIKSPPVILFFVGYFYGIYILGNFEEDTTKISNIAFGIVAVLTGLSLRMASTLANDDPLRDEFIYSGEKFFHSTVLLLSASIIKYVTISINGMDYFKTHYIIERYVSFPFGVLVTGLFFFAVHTAHTGMKVTNDILWKRMARKKDWNQL